MSDDGDDDDAVARLEVDSTLPGGTWESGGANVRSGYVAVELLSDGWFGLRSATQLHTSCINHNQEGRLAGAAPGGTARARAARRA